MFGYVKVYKPELKMKEFEMYKGIYCSLCKQLGKNYGVLSRFFLNYDLTFLSLIIMATKENESRFVKSHCTFCSAKKCVCCSIPDDTLDYTAALTIIMTYHKIRDNISDGKLPKKLLSYSLLPYLNAKYKKAAKRYPTIATKLAEQMENQREIESLNEVSIDRAADATAKALGYVFAEKIVCKEKEQAYRFGYCLGRFIYLCDALDDLEKDRKNKNYNVFLTNEMVDFKKLRENSYSVISVTADEAAKAYETLKFFRYKGILDNIIYYGLEQTICDVLKKEDNPDEKPI